MLDRTAATRPTREHVLRCVRSRRVRAGGVRLTSPSLVAAVEHACRRGCAPARRAGRRVRAAQRRLMVTATDEFPSRFACFCVPRVGLERNGATRVARGVRGELRERLRLLYYLRPVGG